VHGNIADTAVMMMSPCMCQHWHTTKDSVWRCCGLYRVAACRASERTIRKLILLQNIL